MSDAGPLIGAGGHLIGIDLGTSNTVAILRWPDGRTRPLLFDGQPVMQSGVFLDERGQLHVGRDAMRLARADPSRYEPNPKRRIDEPTVLLGDRAVSVVDLLAALLHAVAAATVEACGLLPPAALTHPASWGQRRRDTVAAAAARAGWTSVRLVPEPVAAARYFAEVLRRPVPVGSSLAVFDFGGGTLDVAVVRNDGAAFTVQGSGGVEDLGGLDLDAALVAHLGTVLAASAPDVWAALEQPVTPIDRRQRRLFWEDVRGAKEMLSRATIAPISVPGLTNAVHLTRDEVERHGGPLLHRAAREAATVIKRSGLAPRQLSGLFLVGGSSRVPLVARLLHTELGIAPTVLEQPELPVAEGALAEIPPPSAAAPVSGPISTIELPPARAPWYRRRGLHLTTLAGLVVLAVAAGIVWYGTATKPYREVSFADKLTPVGSPIRMPDGTSQADNGVAVAIDGNRVYFAAPTSGKGLAVTAVELSTGKPLWGPKEVPAGHDRWSGITATPTVVIATAGTSSSTEKVYGLGAADGRQLWAYDAPKNDPRYYFEGFFVQADAKAGRLIKRAYPTGDEVGAMSYPGKLWLMDGEKRRYSSNETMATDTRVVTIDDAKNLNVIDLATEKTVAMRRNVGDPDDHYLVYENTLFHAGKDIGYRIDAHDLANLGDPRTLHTTSEAGRIVAELQACGPDWLCLLDRAKGDSTTMNVVFVSTSGGTSKRVTTPLPSSREKNGHALQPVGEHAMVTTAGESDRGNTVFYDPAGNQRFAKEGAGRRGARVNGVTALLFSDSGPVTGVGLRSGATKELGQHKILSTACRRTERHLACPGERQFHIWAFA